MILIFAEKSSKKELFGLSKPTRQRQNDVLRTDFYLLVDLLVRLPPFLLGRYDGV